MAYNSWSVTFAEQPSATKWNILGTNDLFFNDFITGANGVHAAWTSFTPSWTNLTVGNGTNTGYYVKYGTTVLARIAFTLGTTSSVGTAPQFTLPVVPSTNILNESPIGQVQLNDIGVGEYSGRVTKGSATVAQLEVLNSAGTYLIGANITATAPFTWTTGDIIRLQVIYEATS